MSTKLNHTFIGYLIPTILALFYFTEGYYKIISYSFDDSTFILKLTKLIFISGMCCYIALKHYKLLLWPLILIVVFCIGQFTLNESFNYEVIVNFSKYLYPIILFLFFDTYRLNLIEKRKIFTNFERIVLLNSFLVLIGFLFDIYIFKTYSGNRFGYNGLFITSATSSYIYIISLIYLFIKDKAILFRRPINYLIFGAALLVGTKSIYIFFTGMLLVFFLNYIKKRIREYMILGLLAVVSLLTYFFFFRFGLFNGIRTSEGLFTAIMSHRDILLFEHALPFIENQWQFLNYIFGGIEDVTSKSQIDLIDLFYFFGIAGGTFYLFCFFKLFIVFKTTSKIKWLLGLMIFLVFFGGNFFSYASVAIYILVLREFLVAYETN